MSPAEPPRTTLVYKLNCEITREYPAASSGSGVLNVPATDQWWVRTWVSVDDTGTHMGIRVLGPCHLESRAVLVVGALQQEFEHLYGPDGYLQRHLRQQLDRSRHLGPDTLLPPALP